jgi:hypothetical protein
MKKQLEFRTVEWLAKNTKPQRKYFESFMDFITSNYRDEPDKEKVNEIVDAIVKEKFSFTFPYILNAENFSAVDGLARIYAFCEIKNRNPELYKRIKEKEVAVIFLDELDFSEEAKEYENINQGNGNRDLVVAKLVQNFANRNKSSKDKEEGLYATKIEFLCYELAKVLNAEHNYWRYKINFGNKKINENDFETVSCTDFISSTKVLVSKLEKLGIIDIKLETGYEIEKNVEILKNIFFEIWNMMICNFENAFIKEKGKIIQSAFGTAVVSKYVMLLIKQMEDENMEIDEFILIDEIKKCIINSDKSETYNELSEKFEQFDVWNEKGEIGRFINTDRWFARNLAANILIMRTEK